MNETLQLAVAEILKKTLTTVESAGTFLVAETPEYVRQLLAWNYTTSLIGFILGCIILLSVPVILYFGLRNEESWMRKDYGAYTPFSTFLFLPFVIGFAIISSNLNWLQITIAPKVWLVTYITGLIK